MGEWDLLNPSEIYKYIYGKIGESKTNFIYKYENYFKYYYRDSKIPKKMRPKQKENENKENNEKNNKSFNIIKPKDEFVLEKIFDKNRIILPRLFQECLIRAALLLYSYSKDQDDRNIKLSKKLQKLLNILFPQGIKKSNTCSKRSSLSSKIEQLFNISVAVIDSKNKIQEYCLRKEFMNLFYNTLKNLFNKFHALTNVNNPKNGDKTVLYAEFYYKIVL